MKQSLTQKDIKRAVKVAALAAGLISLAMTSFVACGSKSSGGAVVVPVPPSVVVPVATHIGYYAQTANFVIPGFVADANSRLQPAGSFREVLRDAMGTCDRGYVNSGLANCNDWISAGAHDLVLFSEQGLSTNSLRMVMRSTPSNGFAWAGGRAWYSLSLPDLNTAILGFLGLPTVGNFQGVFNPMVLDTTLWPISNSQGIEMRSYGPNGSAAWNKLFQIQVTNGKLGDPALAFTLYFNSQVAATGTLVRCVSRYCGLDASFFNGRL